MRRLCWCCWLNLEWISEGCYSIRLHPRHNTVTNAWPRCISKTSIALPTRRGFSTCDASSFIILLTTSGEISWRNSFSELTKTKAAYFHEHQHSQNGIMCVCGLGAPFLNPHLELYKIIMSFINTPLSNSDLNMFIATGFNPKSLIKPSISNPHLLAIWIPSTSFSSCSKTKK